MLKLNIDKRKHIIKKAVKETVMAFNDRTPKIYTHFFYGAFDIDPRSLAVWYLFETDAELEAAKDCGFCSEIEEATVKNLISAGYPKEAFESAETKIPADDIIVDGGTDEDMHRVFDGLANKRVKVSFTTQEDVERKANGDYHLYFQ